MFGEKLKNLRENKNLLQKELGDALNVTSQTVSGWEINRTKPDYDMLVTIANYFEVTTDYLLGNEMKASKIENKLKKKEALKQLLIKNGYMKQSDDLSNEELNRLMEFVVNNKHLLKGNK